jgi:hypothetical protein
MSIVVFFIVWAFCSWRAEQEGPLYRKTIWLPLVATSAWVILGFFYPSYSIDAAWSDFLARNHASVETDYERPQD